MKCNELDSVILHSMHVGADFSSRGSSITVDPPGPVACIDFTGLVLDDNIALEGDENFTILIGDSMAMVTITDNDGECVING